MTRIILCDDHKIVREGLRQLIQEKKEFQVMGDASSGEELFEIMRSSKPQVVILDISLPGRGGLEVLKQLKSLYPEMNVLILSMFSEDQFAIRMLRAGASGYLHKDSHPEILFEAIKTVASGEIYLSKKISSLLYEEIFSQKIGKSLPHESLSDREFEVLLLIGEGKKVSQIAADLSLSVKTISTYKTRISEKLGIKNPAGVIQYVLTHDLLSSSKTRAN